MKIRLPTSLMLASLLLSPVVPVNSQVTYAPYIWQKLWVFPNAIPSANEQDVRDELVEEVTRFLDWTDQTNPPRPPGPFYLAQGYIAEDFYWLNTGESVLALSETLDFLPASQRDRLITYLKYVMTTTNISPLTFNLQNNVAHPLMTRSNYRDYYSDLPPELARGYINSSRTTNITPPTVNLYAVWAFANYVSRYESSGPTRAWTIVNNNWSSVTALYSQLPTTPTTYWEVMAYVGYARMAKKLNKPFSTAEARANAGYSAGLNFVQFYKNMKGGSRWCEGNGNDQPWVGVWDYCLFSAIDPYSVYQEGSPFNHNSYAGQVLNNKISMFAPEIGRFLHDYVQNAVVNDTGYGLTRYLSPSGANYYAFWWESKGEKPWGLKDANTGDPGNGENAIMHPSFAWQMFMLKAHVEGAGLNPSRADGMRIYLDTPWAIGDPFHLQKLVTVLRMYSILQWSEADGGSPYMTVTPGGADENQTVTFTTTLFGTGQTQYLTDTLPVQLDFVAVATTCPLPQPSSGGTVTYSGTPSLGQVCTITIQTTVNEPSRMAITNSAIVTIAGAPTTVSALVVLNPLRTFLPVIRR